jgi:trigger factor
MSASWVRLYTVYGPLSTHHSSLLFAFREDLCYNVPSTTYDSGKEAGLKVTTERQEHCIVQLTISVDEEKETEYLRRSARALSREYRIRGFRPGKAPYDVIVQRLGIETVHAEALERFGDEVFEQGLEESELEPVGQASLRDVTWDPTMTLHVEVPVKPEVSLDGYRDIRVTWGVPEVAEEQVNEELLKLQQEQSEWRPDDRPAEMGDQVVLDIVGTVEDEIVLENSNRELVLDPDSPYPVPGFAEAITGMQPGETQEFDLTYPEDHYNAEIAGQVGHFKVTLDEIRVEVLPELDDEFAILVGDYESLDDLKASIRGKLEEEARERAENEYQEQVWEALLDTAQVDYPMVMVDREIESMRTELEQRLQQQGMDFQSYLSLSNQTPEAWAAQARPQAEERLRRGLLLAEVIEEEELTVEPEEVEAEIEEMLEPLGERGEQLREMFESPSGRMTVTERLLTRKAVERLKAIARGEEPLKGNPPSEAAEEAVVEEAAAAEAEAEGTAAEETAAAQIEAEVEPQAGDETSEEPGTESSVEELAEESVEESAEEDTETKDAVETPEQGA